MNKIIILVFVFAGLTGVGILGNVFLIDIQPLGIFASLEDLPDSICKCANSDGTEFTSAECEQFMEGSDYTDSPEMVCQALAEAMPNGMASYGDPPLQTQGCNADFWQKNGAVESQTVWPSGYSPNYYFNEIFQVSITIPDQEDNKVMDDDTETISSLEDETVNASDVTEETQLDPVENIISSDPEVEEILEVVEDKDEVIQVENINNSNSNDGLNLVEALELDGTQLNELLRESVAAMLNAAHSEINYPYSVAEIITMTQIALANVEYDETVKMLKEANDRGKTPICQI